MELLDRYLQAVKKRLPWQRQDDIIAELRANLEAQLEDKESELGRPLTNDEAEAWLKQIGSPARVASRYQPQQYLIGPTLFPTYQTVLRIVLTWAAIIYAIVSAIAIAFGSPRPKAVLQALLGAPMIFLTSAVWVTLIFAAIEYAVRHYPSRFPAIPTDPADWSPSSLPRVENETAPGAKPHSRAQTITEVVIGALGLIWLMLVPQHPYLLLGPGAAYLQISPFQPAAVWAQVYWWIVALGVLQIAWGCAGLLRGSRQNSPRAQQIAMTALGLIPLSLLLSVSGHVMVQLKHPALDLVRYGAALESINKSAYLSAVLIFALSVVKLLWEIGRAALDTYRKRAAAAQ